MENTQEDTITDSTSQLRLLFEKELAKEKSRIRQRHYRLMRKQRESDLQQSYDQLKVNYQALEISLHVISKQSMMHEARANEYKQLCEILINQMAKKHVVSSPGVECIEIGDTEECTIESDNEIKIHEAIIQQNDIPSSFNKANRP